MRTSKLMMVNTANRANPVDVDHHSQVATTPPSPDCNPSDSLEAAIGTIIGGFGMLNDHLDDTPSFRFLGPFTAH